MSDLVVDDEDQIREICRAHLNSFGYFKTVVEAKDGFEELELLKETKYDLIILDLGLPKVSGQEVLESISLSANNDVYSVVLLSGLLDKKIIQQAKDKGVKFFIVKLITAQKFATLLFDFVVS